MANVQYSGVRESKPGRVNDLGTTGREAEENFKKGCLKRADRSFAQGLQCQQINSMSALMSLEDAVFVAINEYILKHEVLPKEKGLINLFAPTTISYADQRRHKEKEYI